MQNIRDKFIHEASELVDALETALLQLEHAGSNKEQVEEVFRVMHTFKGTAKMFGYDLLGDLTHHLENIYDDLRNNRIKLSETILEVSLSAVDYIRSIVADPDSPANDTYSRLLENVKSLTHSGDTASVEEKAADEGMLFHVRFKPSADFLKSGNNPLYLIEDLSALGQLCAKGVTEYLPLHSSFDPMCSYLHFDLLLYTTRSSRDIKNEFLFVEDHCELEINAVSRDNWLQDISWVANAIDHHKDMAVAINERTKQKQDRAAPSPSAVAVQQQTLKVTYEKIDKLMGIVSELVTTQARLRLFSDQNAAPGLEEIAENVEKLVRQLRDEAFSISLLPISQLSMRFERLVRDTSKALQKKIRYSTVGHDIELDKKIIDNLYDPMLHILRNSLDHGIETPAARRAAGKDETGTLTVKAYNSGANVVIEVHDDGAGIDKQKVLAKAIQRGLVKESEQLTDHDIFALIFHPGFSTAEKVTDVSGRGVGMDVVKKTIARLRGEISVDSQPGKGTVIKLILPLSLSIIDGLLVGIDHARYVIPLTAIEKCYEVPAASIKPDINDLIILNGEQVPYVQLRKAFRSNGSQPEYVNIIVAQSEELKVALEVDTIIDEYQAVIKPLGRIYKDQEYASGATILGNGTVALVLDTNRLISNLSR